MTNQPTLRPDRHVHETRTFFAPRAAGWDDRFPDDAAAFTRAVTELDVAPGATVLDLGCGTGRAMPALGQAVGPAGVVLGLDLTPEMLTAACTRGRYRDGPLVLADARRLPLADASVDVVFAAGLITHVPDPTASGFEFARVVRVGGQLAVFHPIGRAALAARHGRTVRAGELLDPGVLPGVLAPSGWELDSIDDAADRYLAVAHLRDTRPR